MVIPFEQCWEQAVLPFKPIQMVLNDGVSIAEWFQMVNVLYSGFNKVLY